MQFSIVFLVLALAVAGSWAGNVPAQNLGPQKQLICYYDSTSYVKEGLAKLVIDDLEPAFQFCNYIIYGYAGIERESYKAISLKENLDLDLGKGLYRTVTRLKRKYPNVKILLSIGGDKDIEADEELRKLENNKYNHLLENQTGRMRFINTAYALVTTYGFDGIDVAWQFNKNKPKAKHGGIGKLWKGFKKIFTGNFVVDEQSEMHKEQFTALMRDLKNEFRPHNLLVSTTVLPNVNSSSYYDVAALNSYVDFVNLAAFDFVTPERYDFKADFTAPLYPLPDREPDACVDFQVQHWLQNGFPSNKINVGISTYGRPWKMTSDSGDSGVPPINDVENAAPLGANTQTSGLYSWQETCMMLPNQNNMYAKGGDAPVKKVIDMQRKNGVYAYRPADKKGDHGIWIGYEDPDSAADKAAYVKNLNLGGVALYDLSYDDFRGLCTGDKYPILRAVKYRLLNN